MESATQAICNTIQTFTTGNGTFDGLSTSYNYFTSYHYFTPYQWWPNYYTINVDVTAKAMKIVKTLMEKKVIELKSIKQFTELVDQIVTLL